MNLSICFLHVFDSYGFCFSFLALVEQIPLTKACDSQCNREACNKRRLTASDYPEGNRRDCNMSGNQTSGKEGGVQCVMMVVCMYICMHVCLISYMSD